MNKEFAMKWADALESGEYQQTTDRLCDGDGYCCLGVACLLAGASFVFNPDMGEWVVEGTSEYEQLPHFIAEQIGMASQQGLYEIQYKKFDDNENGDLATDNDDGQDFKTIAKRIRKYWDKL